MSGLELAVAHAVKIALVVLLVGMVWRGRLQQCWAFGAYVIAILAGNTLVSLWPERFLTPSFWIYKQAAYDLLKLAIALELLYRALRAFPGTWRAARLVVLALLSVSTLVLAALTPRSSVFTMWEWQPSIVTAAIWLLAAVALLVVWYQVPVRDWPRAIMLGLAPYLLVFLTTVDLLRRLGYDLLRSGLGVIDSLAYLGIVLFWSRAAWRREPPTAPAARESPLPEELAVPPAVVARGSHGELPDATERPA